MISDGDAYTLKPEHTLVVPEEGLTEVHLDEQVVEMTWKHAWYDRKGWLILCDEEDREDHFVYSLSTEVTDSNDYGDISRHQVLYETIQKRRSSLRELPTNLYNESSLDVTVVFERPSGIIMPSFILLPKKRTKYNSGYVFL